MHIQIGAKPDASFKDPIGVLTDCHRRVEKFLDTLILVAHQSKGASLDGANRNSFQNALRYFRESAPKHTADEEDSLFPRLRAMPGSREILARVEALEADHVRAGVGHLEVERLGYRWLDRGVLDPDEARQLTMWLAELKGLYQSHIALEESEVFPFAAQGLALSDLAEVGVEMARRRGL